MKYEDGMDNDTSYLVKSVYERGKIVQESTIIDVFR